MKHHHNGFTLLEMIVVLTIITILFMLTVPNIQKTLNIVDKKGCKALLKTVDTAILQYRLEYDQNPASTADLVREGLLSEEQTRCDSGAVITIYDGQAIAGE